MLKCASVYTYEIDDQEVALAEIKAQLEKKITLLEHSVGIIMCNPEFITSGVVKHICCNLPFDMAGITTASQAVNDEFGELILTIFVMTSDDVCFKTGVTDSLNEGVDEPVRAAYEKAAACSPELPKLAILFPPFLIKQYAGDVYLKAWKKVIPNASLFGTLAIDDTVSFNECETIYNGMNKKDAMSFVLCYGNINPRFLIASLPQNSTVHLRAEVTESNGSLIHKINHMNARKFFEDIGIYNENMLMVPFFVDLKKRDDYDGVPVVNGVATFTEDGSSLFCGDVDEGSVFSLLSFTKDDILSTSLSEINRINEQTSVNGALLFSCFARRVVLLGANNPSAELQIAKDVINPDIPFMMGYSGGEFCPTSVKNGVPTNRFHTYSLIILVI